MMARQSSRLTHRWHTWVVSLLMLMMIAAVWLLVSGCTVRKYEVKVYATEGAVVNISPEILAEVPKNIEVEGSAEVDMPDANMIGK